MSIGIAIAIVLLLVLVVLGLVLLGLGLIMLVLRARARSSAAQAPHPSTASSAPVGPPSAPPVAQRSVPPAPPPSEPSAAAPPLAANSGLIGFFDDESSFMGPGGTPSTPREVEGAKTELFQRGKMAIDWDDDDSDEGEATEIFSAHGAAGDLAEFAFDDDDQSTGRFS